MNCKSCYTQYPDDSKFCNHCGGKVVTKRLSFKSFWTEFVALYFNWDNRLWRTIHHLTTKPELVMGAFISGARKKYIHPFAWLTIGVTLLVLAIKYYPISELQFDFVEYYKDSLDAETYAEAKGYHDSSKDKVTSMLMRNYNLFTIALIPVLALLSYLTYKKQKNNYIEHIIFQSYLLIYSSLITQAVTSSLYFGLGVKIISIAWFNIIFMIGYYNYAFIRFYRLGFKASILSGLRFILFTVGLFIGGGLVTALIAVGIDYLL